MNVPARIFYGFRRMSKSLRLFLMVAGPGIIVMVADNDAGGITTYSATGAQFGYNLIWFLVILGPVAYFVQEMTVRLGAVTKRGHAEAIFDGFGSFWGWFSIGDLVLTDFLTLITEFIGMTAALGIFGVPPLLTVILVIALMGAMVLSGSYWTWEKLTLLFCAANLIYIPAAFLVKPDIHSILSTGIVPNFPGGFTYNMFFFIMANIGTTIAPWMIFFQQSSVVDKGLQEKDIKSGRLDTLIGAFATVLVAIFIIIVTATELRGQPIQDAATASVALMRRDPLVGRLMAIGLFDAGLLGAICISLASSWAFGEVFGWAHSLNRKVKEAPGFYVLYFTLLVGAGAIVLIPGAPLILITLFVQVVAVTLLPAALVFLLLLLNDESVMGEKYKNTKLQNIMVTTIVVAIIALSTLYALSALFPHLFAQGRTL